MKYKFIINPTAGRGRAIKKWKKLKPKLKQLNHEIDWSFTKERGHAQKLARQISYQQKHDVITAVGGDGTIWEIVNGIANSSISLGIIPAGSGNDLARGLNLPSTPEKIYQLFSQPEIINLNLGKAKNKFFLNVAGIGFDAEVASTVNKKYKHLSGRLSYISSIFQKLISYTSPHMEIETDNNIIKDQFFLVAIALNGTSFGGGLKIIPHNKYNDNSFTLCLVKKISRLEIIKVLPALYQGNHINHPAVTFIKSKYVKIKSSPPVSTQTDGELIGKTPINFSITDKKLPLLS